MTVGTRQSDSITITRCAVCKVDLKGRFVYIDEHAGNLFGCASEDLFGKNITDFLDTPSRTVVNELLSRRNHYETFYDSVRLNIVAANKTLTVSQTIVSLNFNGGNPVNFQFIFHPDSGQPVTHRITDTEGEGYRAFVDGLIGTDIAGDWRGFLRSLKDFTGARQACVYIVADSSLELRACAAGDGDEHSWAAIDDPGPVHVAVARDGGLYDFTDEQSVRRAVELDTQAPNEVLARVICDDAAYLLRVVFDPDLDDSSAETGAARARFALSLMDRMIASNGAAMARDDAGIQFSVGLLDGLGIGAFVTNSDGRVALYNPRGLQLLAWDEADCAIDDLAAALADGYNDDRLLACLHPSALAAARPPAPVRVRLSDRRHALLLCLPLGDGDDQSSFVILIPDAPGIMAADVCELLQPTVYAAKYGNTTAREKLTDLEEMTPKGNDALRAALDPVGDHLAENAYFLDTLCEVLKKATFESKPEMFDPNVMIGRAVNNINARRPDHPLKYKATPMLRVVAPPEPVALAVESLLDDLARFSAPASGPFEVDAGFDNDSCQLRFSQTEYTGPRAHDCVGEDAGDTDNSDERAPGIAMARLMIQSLGGSLTCRDEKDRTIFELSFPARPAE